MIKCPPLRGISTVGRTSLPYCRPRQTLVNQGNPFKMKGNVTRPADVKRGKLPRKTSGNPYGALAQLVARDIRIVEVRGSTPLCSTRKPCRSKSARFFRAHFSVVQSMQILHSCPWYITQGFSFAACDPSHLFPPGHTRLANTPRILRLIIPFSLVTGFGGRIAIVCRV